MRLWGVGGGVAIFLFALPVGRVGVGG